LRSPRRCLTQLASSAAAKNAPIAKTPYPVNLRPPVGYGQV